LTLFPIAVTPVLRVPVYHTMHYLEPRLAARSLARLLRSSRPVHYELHAVDLLDLERDGVDPRMRRHPGMTVPLTRRIEQLESVRRAIARRRTVLPCRGALRLLAIPRPLDMSGAVPAATS